MKRLQAFPIILTAIAIIATALAENPQNEIITPVVVELFTSEGCSSCPPAEKLLNVLGARQPVAGAEIIPLAFHVDYWNRLGWRDPYSSEEFSNRQRSYARAYNTTRIYTPQMIVNGTTEFVGSSKQKALNAIEAATQRQSLDVVVQLVPNTEKTLTVSISVEGTTESGMPLDVMAAVTESGLESKVSRGENKGEMLKHVGVVRAFSKVSKYTPGAKPQELNVPLTLDNEWNRENLSVVVFLQDSKTMKVYGAASKKISLVALSETSSHGSTE